MSSSDNQHGQTPRPSHRNALATDDGCSGIIAILEGRNREEWRGVIKLDAFSQKIMLTAPPPWEREVPHWKMRSWSSNDDIQAANWMQRMGVDVSVSVASDAITVVADDSRYNPVEDYLQSLTWDERPRLNKWMHKYLGADDSDYNSHVGRCALIASVARIKQPGCKVDTVPILEGTQGKGKSTALRILFEPYFSDELADFGSKDAAMQLEGVWCIEISELDAMTRSDVGRTKAFVSRTTDRYRRPYAKRIIESRRSCTFWGTTNSDNYLKDETGGRRFQPVKTNVIDLAALRLDRSQLWAEAQHRYNCGENWWFESAPLQYLAHEEQMARYASDPWDPVVASYIATRDRTSPSEILSDAVKMPIDRQTQSDLTRVARILKSRDWIRHQIREGRDRKWIYKRPLEGDSANSG